MKDNYGRNIDYLRISITDRCNLRCTYCMPLEGVPYLQHTDILTYEEIELVCRIMAGLGIRHIKITGGEPLVRKHCWELIRKLKAIPLIETVTLTTNGILLTEYAGKLAAAGIDGVNISLDTLDAGKYTEITRYGDVTRVLSGLQEILKYPQITVKINCVLSGKDWRETVISIAGLAKQYPVHVRFIEHMPLAEKTNTICLQDEVLHVLQGAFGKTEPCEKPLGFGPGTYIALQGFQGKIGFISALSHPFCAECNRIRLTADGKLRLCLQSKQAVDLKAFIRNGKQQELIPAILKALEHKPKKHCLKEFGIQAESMSQIGG